MDLVERQFYAEGPDRLWVADITYIPTWSGFLYLAMVLDVYSRRVVGWAMETHLRTELILAALNMAITQRQPRRSSTIPIRLPIYELRVRQALSGSRRDALDGLGGRCVRQRHGESFFATLERELLNRRRFKSQAEAKMAVFEWLEGWYNPHRRHSSLGYRRRSITNAHIRGQSNQTQSFCRLRRQTALAVENA